MSLRVAHKGHCTFSLWMKRSTTPVCNKLHIMSNVKIYLRSCITRTYVVSLAQLPEQHAPEHCVDVFARHCSMFRRLSTWQHKCFYACRCIFAPFGACCCILADVMPFLTNVLLSQRELLVVIALLRPPSYFFFACCSLLRVDLCSVGFPWSCDLAA